jgi:hypothetical protein
MREKHMIDHDEYEALFPEQDEFEAWVTEAERIATITVQVNRDRFLFDQDDEHDEFSPFNTSNS